MFARRPAATVTPLQSLRERARLATELAAEAEQALADAEEAAELADAIEAGDCDADGEPVAYDRYYGGV
jgi:hypothetical protein